jgi:iron complex outermembrane receptor protein
MIPLTPRVAATLFTALAAAPALAQTASPVPLPPIQVEAPAEAERADGPVEGYRATRSATGTKTDTPLKDVPQAVNVIPRQVIEDQQVGRLADVLLLAPNVQPAGTNGGRGQNFFLRGFQSQTFAIDGVMMNPALNFPLVSRDLAAAERVEVLKGPASVLYGRGEPGGLINIVTRKPSASFGGSATLQAGSYDFYRAEGDVTGPLDAAGTLTARMTAALQTEGSFRYDNDDTREYLAPVLHWTPREDTRLALNYEHTEQDSQFDRGIPAYRNRVSVDRSKYYGEDWARYEATVDNLVLRGEHDVRDWLTLRQIVNYQWGETYRLASNSTSVNAAGTLLNRQALKQLEEMDSLDLQSEAIMTFDTGGIGHTLLAGYEYINADRAITQYNATLAAISLANPVYGAQPGNFNFQNRPLTRMTMMAGYLQDQIKLGPQWEALLGLRFDRLDQTSITQGRATLVDRSNVSPRAGLVYKPLPPLSLYASYSTSFSPQTTAIVGGGVPEPETGVQYEVGARYDLVPDRLSLGLALFEITKENVATADPAGSSQSVLTGEQRSRGIEVDLTGELARGWQVIAGVGLIDAEITRDNTIAVGNKLGGIPDVSASLWSTYRFLDGALRGFGLGGGVTYVGQRSGDHANTYGVDAYYRLDATLFYELNDRLRLSLTGRNLTDEHYIEQTVVRVENLPGAPMTVIAGVTAKF